MSSERNLYFADDSLSSLLAKLVGQLIRFAASRKPPIIPLLPVVNGPQFRAQRIEGIIHDSTFSMYAATRRAYVRTACGNIHYSIVPRNRQTDEKSSGKYFAISSNRTPTCRCTFA